MKKPDEPAFRQISIRVSPAQWRKLREYALAQNTTLQALFLDSVTATVAKKGIKL
jgi:hypothetical protein